MKNINIKKINLEEAQPFSDNMVSDYIDGNLADAARISFDDHLSCCEECRAMVSDFRAISNMASSLSEVPIPKAVQRRLRENLNRQLGEMVLQEKPALTLVSGG